MRLVNQINSHINKLFRKETVASLTLNLQKAVSQLENINQEEGKLMYYFYLLILVDIYVAVVVVEGQDRHGSECGKLSRVLLCPQR